MKKFSFFYFLLLASVFSVPLAHGVTISVGIPGNNVTSGASSPGAFISNFYQFAIFIAGILAFAVVVYGGIRYTASAGNPSAQSDAKEWIWGALIGLVLLAGAYLVLNVINPQLTNLTLPTVNNVVTANLNGTPNTTPTTPTPSNGACQSNSCQAGNTCWATNTNGNVTHTCTAGGPGSSASTCIIGQQNASPCLCPSGSQANAQQVSGGQGRITVYTCP
jgi:hypothetical protein